MEQAITPEQALTLAINRLGGQAAMARLLEVAQPTVWGWLNRSDKKELPAEYVLRVEAATRVARHDLRPDLYPRGLQDGIPFIPGEGAAALGELGTASQEWPVADGPDEHFGNSTFKNQHAVGHRSGGEAASSAVDEAREDRPAAELTRQAGAR